MNTSPFPWDVGERGITTAAAQYSRLPYYRCAGPQNLIGPKPVIAMNRVCYLVDRVVDWVSGDIDSIPGSATGLLCDLKQITSPLCASVSPYVEGG